METLVHHAIAGGEMRKDVELFALKEYWRGSLTKGGRVAKGGARRLLPAHVGEYPIDVEFDQAALLTPGKEGAGEQKRNEAMQRGPQTLRQEFQLVWRKARAKCEAECLAEDVEAFRTGFQDGLPAATRGGNRLGFLYHECEPVGVAARQAEIDVNPAKLAYIAASAFERVEALGEARRQFIEGTHTYFGLQGLLVRKERIETGLRNADSGGDLPGCNRMHSMLSEQL